jgi:hypothetical protein
VSRQTFLTISSRSFARRIALMMAMALLIAQFGAQAHAYSHIHAGTSYPEQQSSHGTLCTDCLSFAPLLTAAGGSAALPVLEPQGVGAAPSATVASLFPHPFANAYRSRAPPPAASL